MPAAKLEWLPVNTQFQQVVPYKVSTTTLILQDMAIDLDDFTELQDETIFSFDSQSTRTFEKNDFV